MRTLAFDLGRALGSRALTIWIGDGSNFPGQSHFTRAFERYLESARIIYSDLPEDWRLFTEHKMYEPAFYATVIQDWGSSYLAVTSLGPKAKCLVDLGHRCGRPLPTSLTNDDLERLRWVDKNHFQARTIPIVAVASPDAPQRVVKVRRDYNSWVASETMEDYALRFAPQRFRKWSPFRVAVTRCHRWLRPPLRRMPWGTSRRRSPIAAANAAPSQAICLARAARPAPMLTPTSTTSARCQSAGISDDVSIAASPVHRPLHRPDDCCSTQRSRHGMAGHLITAPSRVNVRNLFPITVIVVREPRPYHGRTSIPVPAGLSHEPQLALHPRTSHAPRICREKPAPPTGHAYPGRP